MSEWDASVIRDLVAGTLDSETLLQLQRAPKDATRFEQVRDAEQARVPWNDSILVPLAEHLYVVEKPSGPPVVKCSCGQEFGDYQANWKLSALVYERSPDDGEVYDEVHGIEPNWMILREIYCPGCATQLEVEAVPPGHPFIFSSIPDLEGYSRQKGAE